MVLFAVEASAVSSGRPCGVYMFSGLTTQVFNIYDITGPQCKIVALAMYISFLFCVDFISVGSRFSVEYGLNELAN